MKVCGIDYGSADGSCKDCAAQCTKCKSCEFGQRMLGRHRRCDHPKEPHGFAAIARRRGVCGAAANLFRKKKQEAA